MVQKDETLTIQGGGKVNLFKALKKEIKKQLLKKFSAQRRLDFDFNSNEEASVQDIDESDFVEIDERIKQAIDRVLPDENFICQGDFTETNSEIREKIERENAEQIEDLKQKFLNTLSLKMTNLFDPLHETCEDFALISNIEYKDCDPSNVK
jgi:hypothetical protein